VEVAAKQKKKTVKTTIKDIVLIEKKLQWYKSFFDNSSDALLIVEPDSWQVVEANQYAAELFSNTKDGIIGLVIPQFRRVFKLLTKSTSPVVLSELTIDTAEGNELMVEIEARFVEWNERTLIQAITRDVTEQYALTDKLFQTDKLVLLGQLIASVAHEIRNPLAAVNLNLQVLERKFEENSTELNHVKIALQGVERISRIVEVTLNFSRPSVPEIKGVNFNNLIKTTLELFSSVTRKKAIRIILELSENLPNVAADEKQMQQVLLNLIKNAADAIISDGKIVIQTYTESGSKHPGSEFVVISVTDSGIGIHPDDFPKIFNPFFTRKEEGTGLGLPITQRIIHQHRGIIDVESKVGEGTTIYIKLPVHPV